MQKETSTTETESLQTKLTTKKSKGRPNSVEIGPFTYDIKYKSEVKEKQKSKKGAEDTTITLGQTYNTLNMIQIKDGMSLPMEKDTVIHEILHAMWYASGAASMGGFDEEATVSLLAPWLLMFFEKNPQVIEYLQTK